MSEQVVLICIPVSTGPSHIPDSIQEYCHICAEAVWVSPASAQVAEELLFICAECAPGYVEATPGEWLSATPEQEAEVREHWGSSVIEKGNQQ